MLPAAKLGEKRRREERHGSDPKLRTALILSLPTTITLSLPERDAQATHGFALGATDSQPGRR